MFKKAEPRLHKKSERVHACRTCAHARAHTCTHTGTCTHACAHVRTHMYAHTCASTHGRAHMDAHTCMCTHVCAHMDTHTRMHTHTTGAHMNKPLINRQCFAIISYCLNEIFGTDQHLPHPVF